MDPQDTTRNTRAQAPDATERDTRERLLDAAQRLYATRGSRGMTTRAVASEAGVNELTLFRNFTNKKGLLAAMTARLAEVPFVDRTLGEANTGDLRQDLLHIATGMHENARTMLPFILRALAEAIEHPEHVEMAAARPKAALMRLTAFFSRRMQTGEVRAGDPLLMAHAFVSMVLSRVLLGPLYAGMVDHPEPEVMQTFVTVFLRGVEASTESERED